MFPSILLRCLCSSALVAALASTCQAQPIQAPAAAFDANALGKATIPLDGPWQFRTGDDPNWASPALDDSAWQPILPGQTWETQGHRDYTGFAWYRRHVTFTPQSAPDKAFNLALYVPYVQDAYEVYWNGALVGGYGKLPPHPSWLLSAPARYELGPAKTGVLAIRVWKSPHVFWASPNEGGIVSLPVIGSTGAISGLQTADDYRDLRSSQYDRALMLLSTLVAVLVFMTWVRNRQMWMLFWLAVALLDPLLSHLVLGLPGIDTFSSSYGLIGEVNLTHSIALWYLLLYLLGLRENKRLVKATEIVAICSLALVLVDTVMVLFDWTRLFPRAFLFIDVCSTVPVELAELFGVVIVLFAFGKRLDAARWMLAISAILSELLVAVSDIAGLGERWTHWTLIEKLHGLVFHLDGAEINLYTIENTLLLISLLYAAWRYSAEYSEQQRLIALEFRSAQEVQKLLIPDHAAATPGFTVESVYLPAQEVGGDFYQVLPAPDGSLLVVVGDVSGKGLKAAMTVCTVIGALRSLAERKPSLVLANLNRVLYGQITGFATCCAALIEPDGRMTVANAGHLAPYCNGQELALDSGLPLGLIADAEYPESAFSLEAGDRLTLISDGVLEATNAKRELFGFERSQAISLEPAMTIASTARDFGQEDDITVLTLLALPKAVLA